MEKIDKLSMTVKMLIVAFLVLLTIFAFIGLAKIAPKAMNSLGSAFSSITSLFSSPSEKIILSLSNNSVKSGESVDIYFEHQNKETAGVYEFKFDCENKNLMMILDDASKKTNLSCNTITSVESNNFKIIPILKESNSFVDSYLYITFYDKENNSRKVSGKTVLTVSNGNGTQNVYTKENTENVAVISTSTITTKQTNTTANIIPKATTPINFVRKADLHISTKSVGVIVNNVFIPKASFNTYDKPAVRFVIGNIGNIPTGPWQFSAVLPTYPAQVFPSGTQPSLAPGEMIEYTLSLGNLAYSGNNLVTINVDTNQTVSELSETNNGAVMTLVNYGQGYNARPATYPYYNYTDDSDLMVRLIEKGYIEDGTNRFFEADSVSRDDRPAIRFEIENRGDEETGEFVFTVRLSGSDDEYISTVQRSLGAGETKRYTVDLEAPNDRGTETFTIRLDTRNDVNETREDNNVLREDIRID